MAQQLAPLTEKPESLTQLVYQALRDAIISKRLPPGERVSEASLARQLRVSKTPVREALLRLHAIGLVEAESINTGVKRIQSPRPRTHELLVKAIEDLGGELDSVVISELKDHIYFAQLRVKKDGEIVEIDSRPSDAIAVAVGENLDFDMAWAFDELLDQYAIIAEG